MLRDFGIDRIAFAMQDEAVRAIDCSISNLRRRIHRLDVAQRTRCDVCRGAATRCLACLDRRRLHQHHQCDAKAAVVVLSLVTRIVSQRLSIRGAMGEMAMVALSVVTSRAVTTRQAGNVYYL